MLVAGLPVVPVGAAEAESSAPAAAADDALTPGEEVVALRTGRSRTVATADPDRFETEVFTEPIHHRVNGAWKRIDPTLVAGADGGVTNKSDRVDIDIAPAADDVELGQVRLPGGGSVSFGLQGAAAVPAQIAGQAALYDEVLPGVDLKLTSQPGALKEEIVLESPDAPRVFDFPLRLEGLTAELTPGGSVALVDPGGVPRGSIPQGFMVDSANVAGGAFSDGVDYGLVESSGALVLRVMLDDVWLDDPQRVYPVTVDPTVASNASGDTWIDEANPTSTAGNGTTWLHVGKTGSGRRRALLNFAGLADFRGNTIKEAHLRMWNTHSAYCSRPSHLRRNLEPFSVSTATWNFQPNQSAIEGAWSGVSHSGPAGSACSATDGIDYPLTDAVRRWVHDPRIADSGRWNNYGVKVFAGHSPLQSPTTPIAEDNTNAYKAFASKQSAEADDAWWRWPRIVIDWENTPPDAPSNRSPAHAAIINNNALKPTFKARFSDPDNRGDGQLHFQVLRGGSVVTGGTHSVTGLRDDPTVSDDVMVSWTIATALKGQEKHQWRVRAYDGEKWTPATWAEAPLWDFTPNSYPGAVSSRSAGSGGYVTTTTPILNGVFTDADGKTGKVVSEIYNNATGAHVVTRGASGEFVPSGANSPWTVPSGHLVNGTTYKWRSRGYDGLTYTTSYSPWTTFTVDTTKPASPTIGSTTHPDETVWYPGANIAASWNAVSDASGVSGYRAVLDQSPTTTITSGTPSTSLEYTATREKGVWWLHVAARDAAGNWGATAHRRFNIGEPMVSQPGEGHTTQKWLDLEATGNADHTGVTFQYRRSTADTWTTVPTQVLQYENGSPVTWPVKMNAGRHDTLVWNVPHTATAFGDGQVWIRGVFAGGSAGVTDQRQFMLNRAASPDGHEATTDVGPGVVNLLTGNYTVTETDVSEASWSTSMTVSRTFNSRAPDARDVTGHTNVFGPGWTASFPNLGAASDWTSLTVDGDVGMLTAADGDEVYFFRVGTKFEPEEGYEDLQLRADGTAYVLTDLAATQVRFEDPSTTGLYRPTRISQTGAGSAVRYLWSATLPRRLQAVVTDKAGDTICSDDKTLLQRGCRMLTIDYTTAGRVASLALTAYNPSSAGMATTTLSRYAYGTDGRLSSVTDALTGLATGYAYDSGGRLASITPPGQTRWRFEYKGGTDLDAGRLLAVARTHPNGQDARTELRYDLPVVGVGAIHQLGRSDVAVWGQSDIPVDAGAVLPPGAAGDMNRATITYLNRHGQAVNVAAPGGRISVTEYDPFGNVVRNLSAENRRRAIGEPDPAMASALLSTTWRYDPSGLRLLEELGPRRQIAFRDAGGDRLEWGRTVTTHVYDEGAPADGGPFHLPTTTTTAGRLDDGAIVDARVTKTEYDWTQRKPTRTIVDPGGLNLVRTTLFNAQGLEIERRQPSEPSGGGAGTLRTRYYTAGPHPDGDADCAGRPEWVNLKCKTYPAAQPTDAGRPGLPVTHTTYDRWLQPAVVTETVTRADGTTATRTTRAEYDAAGRVRYQTITGGDGEAVPTTRTDYDPATGAVAAVRSVDRSSGTDQVLASTLRSYDALGRLVSYSDAGDANGQSVNTATTSYDLLDRPVSINDGKGTQTISYDAVTGLVTQVADSDVGVFTAEHYDHDGNLTRQRLPGDIVTTTTLDETGNAAGLTYRRSGGTCATSPTLEECHLLAFTVTSNTHGQWLNDVSEQTVRSYDYDAAGRLISTLDRPRESDCVRRNYTLDANTNRTLRKVDTFGVVDSGCAATASTTATKTHSYDSADRITDTGYSYDAFGRTLNVPDGSAGGSQLAAAYHANDLVRSMSQGGVSHTFGLDPEHRVRTKTTTSTTTVVERYAYADTSDAPAWTQRGTTIDRYAAGLGGGLSATSTRGSDNGVAYHRIDLQLPNLHGDVAATVAVDDTRWTTQQRTENAGKPTVSAPSDEFGAPTGTATPDRYGWLGAHKRETALASGVILMGVRLYNPHTARFLSTDPVVGGAENRYEYCRGDSVNCADLDGRVSKPHPRFLRRSLKVLETLGRCRWFCSKERKLSNAIYYWTVLTWAARNMRYYDSTNNFDMWDRYYRMYHTNLGPGSAAFASVGAEFWRALVGWGLRKTYRLPRWVRLPPV